MSTGSLRLSSLLIGHNWKHLRYTQDFDSKVLARMMPMESDKAPHFKELGLACWIFWDLEKTGCHLKL